MNKSLRRRVAAVATTATVGGLLLPFLAAGSALAAEPTGITVSPATQSAPAGTSATVTATLTGSNVPPLHQVYFRVIAGPDAPAAPSNAGTLCAPGAVAFTYDCSVTNPAPGTPGTDSVQVFYDAASAGGAYQTVDPSATASVTFVGAAAKTAITPATAKRATDSSSGYQINVSDVNGAPVLDPNATVTISETFPTASAPATNPLKFTDPTATAFPATASGAQTPVFPAAVVGTNTTYSVDAPITLTNGVGSFGVASSAAGTVAISSGTNSTSSVAGAATLTVSPGNTSALGSTANDNNAAALTQAGNTTAFVNQTASNVVTVKNAAGDALGGVTVKGIVKVGPNAGATVTSTGTTDQLGHTTLQYAATAAGTDTLQAFVDQSTHAPNTVNVADPGEPQSTTSVSVVAEPPGLVLGDNLTNHATTVPTTQTSTPVTFTLTTTSNGKTSPAAGLTLNFALDAATTAGKGITIAPTSAATDANGQVTVTATDPAPASTDKIVINASLAGDTAVKDQATINYATPAASTIKLTPAAQTLASGSKVTETTKLVDQAGKPLAGQVVTFGVSGRNNVTNNTGATGIVTTDSTGTASFTYTDIGTAITSNNPPQVDAVMATISGAPPASAAVTFVQGTAKTANLTLSAPNNTAGTSPDPTTTKPISPANLVTITAMATDSFGNTLANKAVTFTSTGVGTFTDDKGNPTSSSTATISSDGTGVATAYVRSRANGTETISASADGVTSIPSSVTVTYTGDYVGITPARVLDTRTGQGSLSLVGGGSAPTRIAANTNYVFDLSSSNLPLNQEAYAFNVTAIGPDQLGNLRVAPTCGGNTPSTSLVNYQVGKDAANAVILPNTGCNQFDIYSENSSVSVAIDAVGYYPTSSGIATTPPSRIVDTRTGLGGSTGPVAGGTSQSFQVEPAVTTGGTQTVKAIALNVTAINPSDLGNLRVYPHGATLPNASNVNYIPGVDKSAFVVVSVPADGKIDVYSDGGAVNVAIDKFAEYPSTSTLVTNAPVRVLDTRKTANTIKANTTLTVQVAGNAGVPADAQAVLVSVTSIHTAGSMDVGNLRVFPAGGTVPTVSTINYVSATSDVANFAVVKLGTNGQLSLYSDGSPIDAAVDVIGYVPAA